MSRNSDATKRLLKAILIVGPLVLCVQVVGVFSPAWLVITWDGVLIHEGIWYTRACGPTLDDCVISTREWIYDNAVESKAWTAVLTNQQWVLFKALTLVSIYGCCVGIACSYIVHCGKYGVRQSRCILVFGGSHMLASCSLLLIPTVKTAQVASKFEAPWTECWSRDVAFVGSLLAFAATVLFTFAITMSCVHSIKRRRARELRRCRDGIFQIDRHRCQATETKPISPPAYSEGAPPAYSDIFNSNTNV